MYAEQEVELILKGCGWPVRGVVTVDLAWSWMLRFLRVPFSAGLLLLTGRSLVPGVM